MDVAAYVSPRTFKPTGDLPEELTGADRWICWQYGAKTAGGKPTKIPKTPAGGPLVKWQEDPSRWMTYEKAVEAYNANLQLSGIGFVLAPELGIVGVDMDHAIDSATGEVAEWARAHVADFDTYTEVSPSGTGFRLFTTGALPSGCRNKVGNREIYNGGRWLTITGNVWTDSPIVARPAAVARYIEAMNAEVAPNATSCDTGSASGTTIIDAQTVTHLRSALAHLRADERETWIAVGQNLKCLGEVGRGLWVAWSQTSAEWLPGDAKKWNDLAGDHSDYRAVFSKAQNAGWVNPMSNAAQTGQGAAAEVKPTLVVASLAGFATRDMVPTRYAVESLIPRKVVTLLAAHGGSGKSSLALSMAAHFSAAQPWGNFAVAGGRALFVSLEDPADLVLYRLRTVIEAHGLDASAVERNLVVVDGTEGDGSLAYESIDFGARKLWPTPNMQQVKEIAAGAGLIVVDNASDAFDGDENNRRMVRSFVRLLAQLARANDAGMLLLAHVDKQSAKYGSQGNSYSGSTAWHNSARSRLALVEASGGLELRHEKANLGRKAESVALRFNEHGVLMPAAGSAPVASIMDASDNAAVLAALRAANEAGINVPTARTGPSTAQHVLQTLPELPQALRGGAGRARFWAALERLRRSGCAGSEDFQDRHRHPRTRFVARDAA